VHADLGTEYEWLVQKVVAPAPHSGMRIYPSSSSHDRMWIPVKVKHWDVRGDIEEFLTSADKRKRVYNIAIASLTRDSETVGKQDVHTVNYILLQMLAFMNKKEPQSEFRFEPQARLLTMKGGENDGIGLGEDATASGIVDVYTRGPVADFLVSLRGKNALVVEVKNGGLGSDGDDLWNLHEAWTECSCKTGSIWPYPIFHGVFQFSNCCKNSDGGSNRCRRGRSYLQVRSFGHHASS